LRLEMEGVLRSWAVPKGLPAKPGERSLAIEVEDHPLDYGEFEGTIPPGNYGAGTVMLWDRGYYTVGGGNPVRAWRQGKIHFALAGEKLLGEWTLVRLRDDDRSQKNWLVIKNASSARPKRGVKRDVSVLSGRTMDEITRGRSKQWIGGHAVSARSSRVHRRRNTAETKSKTPAARRTPKRSSAATSPEEPDAGWIEPMKAIAVELVPTGAWRLEIKFDGYRALALLRDGIATLWSRNRKNLTADYPELADALAKLRCREAVLDGEIVALDEQGRSRFQLLQKRALPGQRPPLRYYVFDVLSLDRRSLLKEPLEARQAIAARLTPKNSEHLKLSPSFEVKPERLLDEVRRQGLEGIIAKRLGSSYEPGRRSGAWLKCRLAREQEFVIGGYTPPQGSRTHFGALLVGYHERKKLLYAGKVGTGFDDRLLRELHSKFQPLRTTRCPFTNLPLDHRSRFGTGMTASAMRRVTWLAPRLVCQVRFSEWTQDGLLRQPVFLGLRKDKAAREVVREKLAPTK